MYGREIKGSGYGNCIGSRCAARTDRGRFHGRFANAAGSGAPLLCRIPFASRINLHPCSRWQHRGYCQYHPYPMVAESRSCNGTSALITCSPQLPNCSANRGCGRLDPCSRLSVTAYLELSDDFMSNFRVADNTTGIVAFGCMLRSLIITMHRWLKDDEPRPTFPRRTDCCLSCSPSNRHLPQAQVTSDARETRSTAGGPVHFGDVAARGHCLLVGANRLDGRSRLDGLVLRIPSSQAKVDRSRVDCRCLRAAGVDFPLPWEKPDGYSGHTAKAHAGYTWPLSLGPASVLRFRRVACAGAFFDHGELVLLYDRRCDVLSVDHPNADRRREPGGPLWG